MPKIVKPNWRQLGDPREPMEPFREAIRDPRLRATLGRLVWFISIGISEQPLGVATLLVSEEYAIAERIEHDRSWTTGPRGRDRDTRVPTLAHRDLTPNRHGAEVEVNVTPPQPKHFAPTHAR
jgi:hypothetical protein